MATLKLEIVTPEGRAYSDDVAMVVLPAIEGEIGVYPAHVPLMTQLLPGELRILKDGKTTELVVGSGFIEVTGDRDRKSTRLNSSHANISYAVFCLKKKKTHRYVLCVDSRRLLSIRRAVS